MTLKIQVASDLHLEFNDVTINNTSNAHVLVLAGDIFVASNIQKHKKFFQDISSKFKHIIMIAGNHEFYGGDWENTLKIIRQELHQYRNIHFLENDYVRIEDVIFIGATLWTDMNHNDALTLMTTRDMMSDFHVIFDESENHKKLHPQKTVKRHEYSLSYFKEILNQQKDNKCVVVSHHCPTHLSIGERFKNSTLMNGAFASDLSEFILDSPQIKLWIHGHVHSPSDYMMGDTRVLCNPRGYPNESDAKFNNNLVLEV